MSQKSNSSRRPPGRLGWPASFDTATTKTTRTTSSDSKPSSRKRPRLSQNYQDSHEHTAAMWVDRFTPTSSADLCIAPKRVKEISSWMIDAVKGNQLKLLVLVGNPGIGKSTMIRVLAKELSLDVLSWNESYVPRKADEGNGFLSVERSSPIDSFQEFLQTSGNGFSLLQLSNSSKDTPSEEPNQKSIILLEELPNLHGTDMAKRFRDIMSQHLQRSQVPTVLIFSDTSEGKHKPDDLEKLIDPSDLYSPSTCIRQIHPATKAKTKKVLEYIGKQINCKISTTLFEELHLQSGGDIRHAIMNLQLQSTGLSSLRGRSRLGNNRDVKLSTFHALGKLLYAKRVEKDGRSVLDFDPEEILERSDLGTRSSLRFLEHHSVDFFTDITELSNAFELYSDAATILDNPDSHRSESSFILDYANSIAGRAVAHTNTKPTPNKFRQFSSPAVFDVLRKRRENERLLDQLGRRLTRCHLSVSNAVGCTSTLITETLPTLRVIVPDDVNPQVQNLYSMSQQRFEKKTTEQEEVERGLQEQAAILEQDDIMDYDSDSDDETIHVSNGQYHISNITAPGLDSRASPIRPPSEAAPQEETQGQERTTTSTNAAFAPVLQEMEIQSNTAGSDKADTFEKELQLNQATATIKPISTPVLKERKLQSRNAEIVVLDDSDDGSDSFAGFKEI